MRTFVLGLILPLALLGVGIFSFMALGKAEPKKVQTSSDDVAARLARLPEATVDVVKLLAAHSDTLDITVSGTVVPFRQINLASEIDGKAIYKAPEARAGNVVRKGQVLYRIDPRDYELTVERLQQLLEQEQAALVELNQEAANTNRMIEVNKEELALHDANLKRLQSLRGGVASQAEVDEVKRARLVAVNASTTLANQLSMIDTRRTRMNLAQKLATNQLEQAKLNLSRCEIIAPVSGIISTENVQADSYTRKGETLAVIEDLESVEVQCNLRVDQLMWVLDQQISQSTGQVARPPDVAMAYSLPRTPVTIEYKVSNREDLVYRWQGHLDRYDGSGMDPQSRTVPCRVVVDEPTRYTLNGQPVESVRSNGLPALVRGMFVDVVIAAKPSRMLLLVPKLAVKPGNVLWKFELNPDALPLAAQPPTRKEGEPTDSQATVVADDTADAGPSLTAKPPLHPDQWDVGYLKILTKVNVLHPFAIQGPDEKESGYWICEVPNGALQAGDKVIVSPLSGIVGDGSDGLRVRREPKL